MKVTVVVHPNSRKTRIEKDLFDNLQVYVSEPPLEGKANKAVIEALAKRFKISKSNIKLVSGLKTKYKIFQIGDSVL